MLNNIDLHHKFTIHCFSEFHLDENIQTINQNAYNHHSIILWSNIQYRIDPVELKCSDL